MHEHSQCEHELKYCKVCDIAYCEKCKMEWKKLLQWSYQQPYITYSDGSNQVIPVEHEIHIS